MSRMNEPQIKRWLKNKTAQWGYIIQRNECPYNIRPVISQFKKTLRGMEAMVVDWEEDTTPVVIQYDMKKVMHHVGDLQHLEDTVIHEICHIPTNPCTYKSEPFHNGHFMKLYRKYRALI